MSFFLIMSLCDKNLESKILAQNAKDLTIL